MIWRLLASLTSKDGAKGFEKNLNIGCDTPMIDVETVEADDFFEISDFTTAGDLPETGNAGFNADTTFVVGGILIVFVNSWRTSADERHTAF